MDSRLSSHPPGQRLASLDAFRGFIMLLMASGGLGIAQIAAKHDDGHVLSTISPWVEHVPWVGGVLWDMIQPSFMFMVGVAVPYSCAKRLAQGATWSGVLRHAFIRAVVLVVLAVLLASNSSSEKQTNWVFTNVLGQIGLGYVFLVMLWRTSWPGQVIAFVTILFVYWAFFAFWPIKDVSYDSLTWMKPEQLLTGFSAHWNPHVNAAASFDHWFLNLFPRSSPFVFNNGGYQTLNFVPSLATMLLGLMTGEFLRGASTNGRKLTGLLIASFICLALGWAAGQFACPIVKRIWTPSWVLWSAGWALLMLAFFFALIDCLKLKRWAFPLKVAGMNSIAIYLMFQLSSGWLRETLARHGMKELFSGDYGPMWQRGSVLTVLWLILLWLYRQRVFLKI